MTNDNPAEGPARQPNDEETAAQSIGEQPIGEQPRGEQPILELPRDEEPARQQSDPTRELVLGQTPQDTPWPPAQPTTWASEPAAAGAATTTGLATDTAADTAVSTAVGTATDTAAGTATDTAVGTATDTTTATTTTAIPVSTGAQSAPSRPRGPNSSAIVLGLVCVVVAGLAIARETSGFEVDWSSFGPGAVVVVGLLLLALGVAGLVKHRD